MYFCRLISFILVVINKLLYSANKLFRLMFGCICSAINENNNNNKITASKKKILI